MNNDSVDAASHPSDASGDNSHSLLAQPQFSYEEFIQGLQAVADAPKTAAKERAGALFILELAKMPDGARRVENFLPRSLKARCQGKNIVLFGYEKAAAEQVVAEAVTQAREEKMPVTEALRDKGTSKALVNTMAPTDQSTDVELNRRRFNSSLVMGVGMGATFALKQLADKGMDTITESTRQQQLRQFVDLLQKNPPPEKFESKDREDAYYREVDRHVRGLVGTVQDQNRGLIGGIYAIGTAILLYYGIKTRKSATAALKEHREECAQYAAHVAGDVLQGMAKEQMAASQPSYTI